MVNDHSLKHDPTPERTVGDGPFGQLILRNVTLIDGTGGPPQGPVDIVIEGNTIVEVHLVGSPMVMAMTQARERPAGQAREIDLTGHFVIPGLFDMHAHIGARFKSPSLPYMFNLWLGHGVTTLREPGCFVNGLDFIRSEADRSERNEIVAPRISPYVGFGQGNTVPFTTPEEGIKWIHEMVERGGDGVKFLGYRPDIYHAALRELRDMGYGSMTHHSRPIAGVFDARLSAQNGLRSIEHWYGIPEALYTDRRVQHYPTGFNWEDEHERFHFAIRAWEEAAPPGSAAWSDLIDELIELGTSLDPTFQAYNAARDLERVQNASWHHDYAAPQAWDFFKPNKDSHGSYYNNWSSEKEAAWKRNYPLWMAFVREFHNRGGVVTVGADASSQYKLYGFGVVEELEMLREAGLQPLEIIRAATLSSAEILGVADTRGSVVPGKLADLVVLEENPLENLKLLYGNGRTILDENGDYGRKGGVKYTVKDGIVYDARELLAQVRAEVIEEREKRGMTSLHG